jgi:CPA1 family monovalent cation:H+ antiporter
VLAAIGGAFVPSEALGTFVVAVIGGIAIGLAVGLLFTVVLDRLENPPVEVALSLVIPYAAYLPSVQAGLSGVLAAVVAGLVIGRRSATILSPDTRLLALGAWETVRFLLNGFAFILVGLQLPTILGGLSARGPTELLGIAAAVTTGVVLARFAWVFATGYLLPRSLIRSLERTQPELRLPVALIASWAGLRGAVSLAAALALPAEFPERNLLILVTFAVILATLVGQGLTLPLLLRRMELPSAAAAEAEETRAREVVIGAGLAELDRIRPRWPTHQPLLDRLEAGLHDRRRHLSTEDPEETDERIQERLEHEEIQRGLIAAQRQAVIDLRDRGEIGDEVLRTIQRELDLEELRMEA